MDTFILEHDGRHLTEEEKEKCQLRTYENGNGFKLMYYYKCPGVLKIFKDATDEYYVELWVGNDLLGVLCADSFIHRNALEHQCSTGNTHVFNMNPVMFENQLDNCKTVVFKNEKHDVNGKIKGPEVCKCYECKYKIRDCKKANAHLCIGVHCLKPFFAKKHSPKWIEVEIPTKSMNVL